MKFGRPKSSQAEERDIEVFTLGSPSNLTPITVYSRQPRLLNGPHQLLLVIYAYGIV